LGQQKVKVKLLQDRSCELVLSLVLVCVVAHICDRLGLLDQGNGFEILQADPRNMESLHSAETKIEAQYRAIGASSMMTEGSIATRVRLQSEFSAQRIVGFLSRQLTTSNSSIDPSVGTAIFVLDGLDHPAAGGPATRLL